LVFARKLGLPFALGKELLDAFRRDVRAVSASFKPFHILLGNRATFRRRHAAPFREQWHCRRWFKADFVAAH
jgi:hypothetical protein